jgi:probable DNA repair protein
MYEPLLEALQSGATVVTANNRLARSLAYAYGREQQRTGAQAWPSPDVVSWTTWLQQLWLISELEGGRAIEVRRISDTDATVLWEEIVRKDQGEFGGFSGAVFANKAWKLLCEWQAVAAPEWISAGLSPDQQIFLRWLGVYRNRLIAEGWVDGAALAAELFTDVESGIFDDIGSLIFAGFDVWTPARIALKNAFAQRGVEVSVAPAIPVGNVTSARIECANDIDELIQAARWARSQIESDPENDVCVIVRDLDTRAAEARRVFMNVFCPDWRTRASHTLPVNFSYGDVLLDQPRVGAALNLLWLAEGDTGYQRFSLALRSTFLAGGRSEANERAQLDLYLRDRLGAICVLKDVAYLAKKRAPEMADLLGKLADAKTFGKQNLAEWADWITSVLKTVGWPGDDTLDSMAYQELEAWHQLLRDFAASAKVHEKTALPQALALLERLAGGRLYQPEGGVGVVQVMGVLEAAGHEFDRLWVTGMSAEDWPPAGNPNPLIPFELQRRLCMPGSSPDGELDFAEALTNRLKLCSSESIFSWAGMRDGEALHPSGLIADLPISDGIQSWPEPSWAEGMLGAAPVTELSDDWPVSWIEGAQARGGASLFRMQASCPLRAFLELRLGAGEVDDPVTGIGFKERGSLAHNVLEDFYKHHRDSSAISALDEAALADEMNELTAKHIRAMPGLSSDFMRTIADLETQRLMPLLMDFVALDRAREEFTVVFAEEDDPHVAVGPLTLWLKMDRLDRLANGDLVVIDYKTGKVARGSWNPSRPGDMQLPLYATYTGKDIKGVTFAQLSAHEVKYEGLADESVRISGVISPAELKQKFRDDKGDKIEAWDKLTAAWRVLLLELAKDFAEGNCSINPRRSADAEGQMAVLTRVYDLPGVDVGGEAGDG